MTTTAALLVTVAVTALSGCVTVRHPVTPGAPADTAPSQPTAPRPDGSAEPRVVQAPAVEALEMVGPSRHPERSRPPARHRPPAAPQAAHRPAAPPEPPHAGRHPDRPRRPVAGVPAPAPAVPSSPDVCALGKMYGGWRKDSPEARICERTYGR
ncbi:hypothetical protein ACF073_39500 [Streptomyces sp. NPDC015171]|uniref:hypothetical protein n=1 Tax=Streptomyces sp. NPDC015171 TaxID=3364945 RepID=UPI0036F69399